MWIMYKGLSKVEFVLLTISSLGMFPLLYYLLHDEPDYNALFTSTRRSCSTNNVRKRYRKKYKRVHRKRRVRKYVKNESYIFNSKQEYY